MVSALISALKASASPPSCWRSASPSPTSPAVGSTPRRSRPPRADPSPGFPPELMGFRFPDPDAYPLQDMPWIKSREDLIAHYTRGEDPEVVRRYVEGPEDELIAYLGRGPPPIRLPGPGRAPGPSGRLTPSPRH